MKFKIVVGALCVVLLISTSAQAATKPITIKLVKPLVVSTLAGSASDGISAALLTSSAIIISGTVEGTGGSWVSSTSLGGTDGYIAALDFTGTHLWELRLGGAADEIASAVAKDKTGNIWVVGSSTVAASPSTTASPAASPSVSPSVSPSADATPAATGIPNPDGVVVDPTTPGSAGLTRLMVWKVSRSGTLLSSYYFDAASPINPKALTFDGTTFTVSGQIASGTSFKNFALTFDESGTFGLLLQTKAVPIPATSVITVAAGSNLWRVFTTSKPIPGIASWKPKKPTAVAVEYSKTGRLLDARSLGITPIISLWQRVPGLVLLSEQTGGFGLTIVTPLAR